MLTTLPTIAEISIVITGFVGLIIALRPSMITGQNANGIRLRLHVLQTITLVFLCLLPGFINEFSLVSPFDLWPVANAVMAVTFAIILAWRIRVQFAAPAITSQSYPFILAVILYFSVIVFCGLNTLGVVDAYGAPIYFAGILTNLATSCATFVLLLFSVNDKDQDDV